MTWWTYALLSAGFAAATAILAKVGVEGVPSTLATALRTVVILAFAWGIAFVRGEHHVLPSLSRKTLLFLALSGVATGLSWLAYFRALQLGPASRVAPIDKLSLALTVLLAVLFLKEPLSWRLGLGVSLMVVGSLLTLK
ncbi:EamA family transporter [Melittangium boletus]|uniref:Membrane protein n=1 Tax=Melittangium boletus DSM 14713 TaxID=1294270 RepID=A0A250IJ09_9BACT|nr:EamA family transporter [Melittangium boletus]ATB31210.1 membrane protein [Melittangium boletus DSM 14713]